MMTLLADAAPVPPFDWTPAISAIGSVGFAVFFAAYAATKLIPDLIKDNREQVERLTSDHRESVEKVTTQHAATIKEIVGEMKEQRNDFDRWKTNRT